MTRQSLASKNPDIIASVKALRRAARRALELGLSTGTPVYVLKGGEIVDLTREASETARDVVPSAVRAARATYTIPGSRKRTVREGKAEGSGSPLR